MQGPLRARRRTPRALLAAATLAALALAAPAGAQDLPQIRFTVEAFRIDGDNPLGEARAADLVAPFLGEQTGLGGIQAAAKALEDALIEAGYSFHRVIVPPQRAAGGEFRLEVVAFRIRTVEVSGNRHFSADNVRASLPAVAEGVAPNTREVARGLLLANEHAAKRVAVFVREQAENPGELLARVEVRDAKPWRVFASATNTGDDATGRLRLSLGAQHSNLFDRDHALTVSYTTAPGHYGDVKQRGVFYRIPLYRLASSLSLFYASSRVNQGTVAEVFDVSGAGRFKGARLAHALLPRGDYSDRVELSLDDRVFDNDVSVAGIPVTTPVRSRPLTLRYAGRLETDVALVSGQVEVTQNLTSGRANDRAAYRANGADTPRWRALRAGVDGDYQTLEGWRLRGVLEAQHAFERLIPGEQFGLGGAGSVRGFDEREVAGDSGAGLTLEAWMPPFDGGLSLLGFLDLGVRHLRGDPAPKPKTDWVASTGVGLRWSWKGWLSLSADLARVLNGNRDPTAADATVRGDHGLHFSLLARY